MTIVQKEEKKGKKNYGILMIAKIKNIRCLSSLSIWAIFTLKIFEE